MKRFENIDILRGIVMIFMCIDHARDYTGMFPSDPMIIAETPIWLYCLRILAHVCAPTFIFLSGISIGIISSKKDKKSISKYLFSRGLFLCLLEITIVNWGWSFNPFYKITYLQVIWAIGVSMLLMAILIHLKRWMILIFSLLIILGHNLVSGIQFGDCSLLHYGWSFMLQKNLLPISSDWMVRTTYPILPVAAVMSLGYLISNWFTKLESKIRKHNLYKLGSTMLVFFFITRLILNYGDPHPIDWNNFGLSLINLTKYPMSLGYISFYLSLAILFLAISENIKSRKNNILKIFGSVPLFFYILHLYILHLIILSFLIINNIDIDFSKNLGGVPPNIGFPAWWLIWVIPFTIGILYFPCLYYKKLKEKHKYYWTKFI